MMLTKNSIGFNKIVTQRPCHLLHPLVNRPTSLFLDPLCVMTHHHRSLQFLNSDESLLYFQVVAPVRPSPSREAPFTSVAAERRSPAIFVTSPHNLQSRYPLHHRVTHQNHSPTFSICASPAGELAHRK